MDMKKLAMGVVAMVVAIVIVVSCAIPIISDSVATEDTFTNDGYFRMTKYTDESLTMSYDHTDTAHVTVNGELVALPDLSSLVGNVSLVVSDIFCLRLNTNGNIQMFSGSSNTGAVPTDDWTFVAEEGTATFTNVTASLTRTSTYDVVYAISNDGSWVMKKYEKTAYMNGDSFFMGAGLTSGSSAIGIVGINVSGSIEDGATIDVWRGSDITISNIQIVKTNVTDHIDLYNLDKITFTATNSSSDTLDITYSYYVVPYQVTAERTIHVDGPTGDILTVIPVMMVLGIVIGAIALFIKTKRD